ncbi:MAG: hypothetical protein E7361_04530, partial [Clostridiales bacterium]|nr:hypothetical protein [Clostridiales bacterium]
MRLEDIIIPKNLKNTLSYGVERAGMTTEDKVYLYSAEEVMKSSNRARAIIPTDYAILNNAMVNFDYGYSMLRSSSEGDNRVDNIDYDADLITSGISVHDTQYIVAPVMNIDESAVLAGTLNIKDISARYDVSEDDTHAVEFGEYPKTYVDNIVNKKLEELYTSGGLTPTGKAYFCGVGGDSGLTPLYNLEYMTRDNDKYVRVFSRKYDSDSILSDGTELPEEEKPFWVRVEPIEWRIMNWDNLSTMINPNGTGEDDYLELQTQYGIISGIPFYPKNEDESEACVLWQNSTIRGYLNGINVNNIKENGNPDYSAPNGGDFSIYNGGFLGEALGINLPKTAVIEESKEVIKDVVDKKKPKGYGVQVLDHPMTVREQLQFYITNGKSFMLHGPSGVGKTRRIEEADPDFTSITLRNGILPEEVIGKTIYPNNDKTKAGTWVPPAWYVSLLDKCNAEPNKNHVLFIDEITNVKPVEQSLVFHLVLNNMIGPNVGPLPENVVVVAAGNSKEESESAYTMTEPLFRRFDGHVYLKPDVHQFLEWGSEPHPKDSSRPKVHPLVANFVATYGDKV